VVRVQYLAVADEMGEMVTSSHERRIVELATGDSLFRVDESGASVYCERGPSRRVEESNAAK
jgi:hypothetical protein